MSLYLEHFGLAEPPFRITPHTDFFFAGANRGQTLEALIWAITQDEGIVKVTGEVGSGKTMLCRMLLERLPPEVETLYLANPSLSRDEILAAIADELGIPVDGASTHSRMRALQDALVERYAAGRRVVILIDEAHAMPAESLEEIRLLSNLESKSRKLLQIGLFAQPELDERLAARDLRQLRERITQHFNLDPLTPTDVASYIEFRLRAANYRGPNPFSEAAIGRIAKTSEGLSRRINILADKALLAAFSNGRHQVDAAEVKTAIADARFAPIHQTGSRPGLWLAVAAGIAAVAAIGYGLGQHTPAQPVSAPAAAAPSVVPPLPTTITPRSETPPAPATPAPVAAKPSPPASASGLLATHTAALAQWLPTAKPREYFIQLYATDASRAADAEKFLARAVAELDPQQLRAYRSDRSGQDRIGIIYGQFESRAAATRAMQSLPPSIRAAQPYPRQVERLLQ